MVHVVNMAFQSINNVTIPTAINKPHLPKNRFSKVTQYTGRVSANTRLHQLCWGEWEMGTAISCTECSQLAGLMYYPKGWNKHLKFSISSRSCPSRSCPSRSCVIMQLSFVTMHVHVLYMCPQWKSEIILLITLMNFN